MITKEKLLDAIASCGKGVYISESFLLDNEDGNREAVIVDGMIDVEKLVEELNKS